MGFSCGIIGLPNVGKSTIFNALGKAHAQMANYPFCTIEPNRSVVPVPDERLRRIGEILSKEKPRPTAIEFIDVAGLVEGASKGEGLGNRFLGYIRNVDALVHIVRCFSDGDVAHVTGNVDPLHDIAVVNTELMLADLNVLERASEKLMKQQKAGERQADHKIELIGSMIGHLNAGKMLRSLRGLDEILPVVSEFGLITTKPTLYLANLDEDSANHSLRDQVREFAAGVSAAFMHILGKLEEEISELPGEDEQEYLEAMGLKKSSLDRLIENAYRLLDIITFYTVATDAQAWTIAANTTISAAASKIHTDFEKGFVRAEVYHYEDLVDSGSEHRIREHGLLQIEGRDYVVQDGDIIHFLFSPT